MIYINFYNKFISSGTIQHDITDHFPIFASIQNINDQFQNNVKSVIRDYSRFQKEEFREALANINWNDVIQNHDVNNAYDTFVENVCQYLEYICPFKNKNTY